MDIFGVVSLVITGVATAISIMAWKAAQRSADAAERQALEASRSVQVSQVVALHDAQVAAQNSVPKVAVHLEDIYETPCVLVRHEVCGKAGGRPAPETLDPIRAHRVDFLGKRFRGILVNSDTRPITVIADQGLFVEGVTPLWKDPVTLPRAVSAGTYFLDPRQVALFEWFGSNTVIDWYELARMPAAKAFEAEIGIHVPYTVIIVNHAGDEQWALPSMKITLQFARLPVYLPFPGFGQGATTDRELLLLGQEGRSVGCDVRYRCPRVPQVFTDLIRAD